MTHLWRIGAPISVEVDADGLPSALVWDSRLHPITLVSDRWRVDVDWWRGRVWRMYFTVVTSTGLLLDIYHDLLREAWFIQRVYD